MFRLTKQERNVVAFIAAVLLLGTAVKFWRAQHPAARSPAVVAGG